MLDVVPEVVVDNLDGDVWGLEHEESYVELSNLEEVCKISFISNIMASITVTKVIMLMADC